MIDLIELLLILGLVLLYGVGRAKREVLNDRIDLLSSRLNRVDERLDSLESADREEVED